MPIASLRPAVVLLAMVVVTVLAACGGGAGGGGSSGPTVTLSGTATFTSVPTSASGLDYGAATSKPIRTTVVQVRNSSGSNVLYESSTDAAGNWTIPAPQSSNVLVMVVSRLGTPSAVTARVVNNQSGDALYAVYVAHTTGTVNETGIAINAASGWDGDSYGSARAAAPFAILDVIYQAQQLILSADSGASFPLLTVGWSTNNSTVTIGTSHYNSSTGRLSILGKEDEDTDEYDTHVIAHEWGHWFEDNFSRSDSLGGPHGSGDILDESVAFGEGWGNAFSGMVMNDPRYRDTVGVQQGSTGVSLNLESDSISDSLTVDDVEDDVKYNGDTRKLDGGWSETSVQELLWDAYDGGPGALADTDADGVSLGFAPLYDVLVGPQKTFNGFTSIYSFMYYLKAANAGSSGAITALEAAENIGAHDAYDQAAAGFARYTHVRNDGVVVTHDLDGYALTTYDTYGPFSEYEENKLYNRMMFTATMPSSGEARLRVIPVYSSDDVRIRFGGPSQDVVDVEWDGEEYADISGAPGALLVFSVTSFPIDGNPSGVTPFEVQFGIPSLVGKPQADPPPPVPVGNG